MKPLLITTMSCAIAITILLPMAYALTPRSDFGDNVSTYRFFGGTRVCGDHLCKPGEWNALISNMFFSQIQKFGNTLSAENPFSDGHVKNASYDSQNAAKETVNGYINKISTFAMDDGRYTSFVSVTNNGSADANYIVISQTSPDVKTIKAWISPQWNTSITLYKTAFDTSKTSLGQGDTLNAVIVTDGKPSFSLDSLSSR